MRRILISVAILGSACGLPGPSTGAVPTATDSLVSPTAAPVQPGTARPSQAGPDREPSALPRLPQEQVVVDAIASAGFQADRVAVSKFEVYPFAEPVNGRVFYRNGGDRPFRVDVLFLGGPPGEIRVCPRENYEYSLTIDSRPAVLGATAEVFFGVSERFFVIAWPRELHSALVARLALAVPVC